MASLEQDLLGLRQAIGLRLQRHEILASNVANADTPHYKARDFDFRAAMANAMSGQSGGVTMTKTAAAHLDGKGNGGLASVQYRKDVQSAVDGNTVDMDVERAAITDNAIQYQILAQMIGDKFKGMRSALVPNAG